MLHLLRHRNFSLLWFGQLISVGGDWILGITLPFFVYSVTGSTLATGVVYIINTAPRVLLGSVAGVFVDRWDRRMTMIGSDLARAVLLLALLLVHGPSDLWIVYAVVLLQAAISQFFSPAEMALLPSLVRTEELVQANSLNSLGANLARLLAPPLGGAVYAWQGLGFVTVLDSASFLFSAVMLALIVVAPRAAVPTVQGSAALSAFWREWLDGLTLVRRDRLLRGVFAVLAVGMIAEGVIEVLLVPFVRGTLAGDAVILGWMMTAQAAGSVLGGSIIGWIGARIRPAYWVVFGMLGWGLFDLGIFNAGFLPLILSLFVLVGIPLTGLWVSATVLLQEGTVDQFRGRVFGAFGTTTALMTMIGMLAASALGDRAGAIPLLNAACLLLVLLGLAAPLALPMKDGRRTLPPVEPSF